MDIIDWKPFLKSAFERNPVSNESLKGKDLNQVYILLNEMSNNSIYDDVRLAQPDEVWNFKQGDGIEKALLLANNIINNKFNGSLDLNIGNGKVILKANDKQYEFVTNKELTFSIDLTSFIKVV
jgi:hypothetical protein